MVKTLKMFFILILFFITELTAQSVSALASVDSSDYLVGDYINYTLEVITDKNIQIASPFIRDSLKGIEIINELEQSVSETEESKTIISEMEERKKDHERRITDHHKAG